MKILIISALYAPYHIGGAELSTQLIAEQLAKKGRIEVTVLTHGLENSDEIVNGVKVLRRSYTNGTKVIWGRMNGREVSLATRVMGKSTDIFKIPGLVRFYSTLIKNYDIIIVSGNAVNMGRTNIWIAAYKKNIPIIQILRDPILLYFKDCMPCKYSIVDNFYRRFSLRYLSLIPYVVAPTKKMIDIHKQLGAKFNKEIVIPNAVDTSLCKIIPYEEKKDSIIYVGAISKRKGCHTLINAFLKFVEENPTFNLILVGKLEDVIIPDNSKIKCMGYLNIADVYNQMAKSKLLVLPSEWDEAFGRVIVEAVFNGTVAIGSNRGGIGEILVEKKYLFEAGSMEQLVLVLNTCLLVSQSEYKENLNEQLRICKKYSLENNSKLWINVLEQIRQSYKKNEKSSSHH